MSSWKALAWAKDQAAGSPLNKLVLLLLAEKADEAFSCYPSVRTLIKETEASERGVRGALSALQDKGLITTVARRRPNGAQTSSRYYMNAPAAPHMTAGELPDDIDPPLHSVQPPPRQSVQGGGAVSAGGGCSQCRGRGCSQCTPMNYPGEQPPPPRAEAEAISKDDEHQAAAELLRSLPAPWTPGRSSARELAPSVTAALAAGWDRDALGAFLAANPGGAKSPAAVLRKRVKDIPAPPKPAPATVAVPARRVYELSERRAKADRAADDAAAADLQRRCDAVTDVIGAELNARIVEAVCTADDRRKRAQKPLARPADRVRILVDALYAAHGYDPQAVRAYAATLPAAPVSTAPAFV